MRTNPSEFVDSVRIKEVIISGATEEKLLSKHRVHAYEVEELFLRNPRIEFVEKGRVRGQDLYIALGQTESQRYLSVFFINKGKGNALIITARDMNATERNHYGKTRKR